MSPVAPSTRAASRRGSSSRGATGIRPTTVSPDAASRSSFVLIVSSRYSRRKASATPSTRPIASPASPLRTGFWLIGFVAGTARASTLAPPCCSTTAPVWILSSCWTYDRRCPSRRDLLIWRSSVGPRWPSSGRAAEPDQGRVELADLLIEVVDLLLDLVACLEELVDRQLLADLDVGVGEHVDGLRRRAWRCRSARRS